MVSILQDLKEKIKAGLGHQEYFTALVLVLVAVTAFGLGRQSVEGREVKNMAPEAREAPVATEDRPETLPSTYYVGSRNGEVYHLPHCSGAKRINEANRVTFNSKAEAEAAGYRPAANCKGI